MPGPRGPGGQLDLNRPIYPLAAAIQLLEHGAHLVLVARWGETKRDGTQSKRPLWRKYLRRPASFMQVKDHITGGGLLGIVPASLGRAVLDVDQGDPTPLDLRLPALVRGPLAAGRPDAPLVPGTTPGTVAGACGGTRTDAAANCWPAPATSSCGATPCSTWPRRWTTETARGRRPSPRWPRPSPGGTCPRRNRLIRRSQHRNQCLNQRQSRARGPPPSAGR